MDWRGICDAGGWKFHPCSTGGYYRGDTDSVAAKNMIVKLYTKDGEIVTAVTIPSFQEAPDVLIWNERAFVPRVRVTPSTPIEVAYFEVSAYTIPRKVQ